MYVLWAFITGAKCVCILTPRTAAMHIHKGVCGTLVLLQCALVSCAAVQGAQPLLLLLPIRHGRFVHVHFLPSAQKWRNNGLTLNDMIPRKRGGKKSKAEDHGREIKGANRNGMVEKGRKGRKDMEEGSGGRDN